MSSKTLSNGTLSLRFMRNAHHAKNLAEVEAEKAVVKDDGEWEVSKEVRQAWGLLSGDVPLPSVTYEYSYLPFLFSDSSPSHKTKLSGRRTFNQDAHEANLTEVAPTAEVGESQPDAQDTASHSSRTSKRPLALPRLPPATTRPPKGAGHKPKGTFKTAQQLVHSNSDVGTDLRLPPARSASNMVSLSNIFLKPSGVDEPTTSTRRSDQDKAPTAHTIKRGRDLAPDPQGESQRRKKTKAGAD